MSLQHLHASCGHTGNHTFTHEHTLTPSQLSLPHKSMLGQLTHSMSLTCHLVTGRAHDQHLLAACRLEKLWCSLSDQQHTCQQPSPCSPHCISISNSSWPPSLKPNTCQPTRQEPYTMWLLPAWSLGTSPPSGCHASGPSCSQATRAPVSMQIAGMGPCAMAISSG